MDGDFDIPRTVWSKSADLMATKSQISDLIDALKLEVSKVI